jgi:hypothetical protein
MFDNSCIERKWEDSPFPPNDRTGAQSLQMAAKPHATGRRNLWSILVRRRFCILSHRIERNDAALAGSMVAWLAGRQSHGSGGQARQSGHSVWGEGWALAAQWPRVARRRRGGGVDIGSGRSGVRDGRWHTYRDSMEGVHAMQRLGAADPA